MTRDSRQLILPTVGTIGGVALLATGQWAGWLLLIASVLLYVLWGLRRRGIVL